MTNEPSDPWNKWSMYVLKELERLNVQVDEVKRQLEAMRVDIATLKVKAGIWGLIGGAIPVAVGMIMMLMQN